MSKLHVISLLLRSLVVGIATLVLMPLARAQHADHASTVSVAAMPAAVDTSLDVQAGGSRQQNRPIGYAAHDHGTGSAPAGARDADTYAEGERFVPDEAPPHAMTVAALVFDHLERSYTRHGGSRGDWDLHGFVGGDVDRLWLKSEGSADADGFAESRNELLWGHAMAPFWDRLLGLRHDEAREGQARDWLAFGVQGLAPWWFGVEATAYLGDGGRSALRLAADYDLLLSQRLILQPRVEAAFYGRADAANRLGAGLAESTAGLRLRYEVSRRFSPYLGVEWNGRHGATADFARADGTRKVVTRYVAGLRFWF
jgi:copper resistance protein B